MEALLLVAGGFIAFASSAYLQVRQRRIDARVRLYLDLLPEHAKKVRTYRDVAKQDPNTGPLWFLADGNWLHVGELDAAWRHAVIAGHRDVDRMTRIREEWLRIDRLIEPEYGGLNEQVIGQKDVAEAAAAAMHAIDAYLGWLERRLDARRILPWRRPPLKQGS